MASGPPPIRILIVDDDPGVLESADRMLASQGFVTATAFDGPGALQVDACLGPFELLIAAVNMPDMPGPELAQLIRRRQPKLKVVYLTSQDQWPREDIPLADEADCALSKSSGALGGLAQLVASLLAEPPPHEVA